MFGVQAISINTPDPQECHRIDREDRDYYNDLYDCDIYGEDD